MMPNRWVHKGVKNLVGANESHGLGCRSTVVPGPRSFTSSKAKRLSKDSQEA